MRLLRSLFLASLAGLAGCSGCDDDSEDNPPPPAAPSGLLAFALPPMHGRIDLTWTDNSTDELEFLVEVSRNGTTFVEIASLPPGTTAYSVRWLLPGTIYWFRVRAHSDGGYSAYAGPATTFTGSLAWSGGATTLPGSLSDHAAVYDSAGQRLIVFGGYAGGPITNQVWSFDLAGGGGWTELTPASGPAPSPRAGATAVYDSTYRRLIVFGGDPNPLQNDVWAFDLEPSNLTPGWTELRAGSINPAPPFPPVAPTPRFGHAAVFDAANQRMIVFGGNDGTQTLNDLWSFPLPAAPAGSYSWFRLIPFGTPPSIREEHTAVYDSAKLRMIVFGGIDNDNSDGSALSNGVWALNLGTGGTPLWARLAPLGTPPAPRTGHAAVYDPLHRRMIVFGGEIFNGSYVYDVWTLGLDWDVSWVNATPLLAGPAGRVQHTAVFDVERDQAVLLGGYDDTFTPYDELWLLGN